MNTRTLIESMFNAFMCAAILVALLIIDGPNKLGRQLDALMGEQP